MGDPIADINSPSPPPIAPLSGRNWLILVLIAIFGLYCGIHVIVTKKASAGPGFHGGPAQLTTSQAWFMGAAYIFGGAVLPYGYLVVRRKQLAQRAAQDTQEAAELVAEGMTPSEATEQIAADRGEKRRATRKQGLLFIGIGSGLMLAGFVGGIAVLLRTHNIWYATVGVVAVLIGKYYFFWPGVRFLAIGRRNYNDVD
jgi:hypothetical protein